MNRAEGLLELSLSLPGDAKTLPVAGVRSGVDVHR